MVSRVVTDKPIVLVVEDEPILRMMAVDLVEDAGFGTLEATNADEAIGILEGRSDIRVVFTDINMPGSMNGMRLARCVRGRWPPIELVITSGHYGADDIDLPAGGAFFPKPYNGREVVATLRRMAG